ncbi:MAG: tail fiber domain-containing protein, partial [Minisyncoccia bacterium]
FYIKNDGNVGIGMTNPLVKLDVNGVIGKRFSSAGTVASPSVEGALQFIAGDSSTLLDVGMFFVNEFTNNSAAYMAFKTRDADTTIRTAMTIYKNGNVGIGTANPTDKLQVVGNGSIGLGVDSGALSQASMINFRLGSTLKNQIITNATTGDLAFWVNNGNTNALNILQSNGNVGIGTTAPTNPLNIGTTVANFAKIAVKQANALPYNGIFVESASNNEGIAIGHTGTYGSVHTNYTSGGTYTNLALNEYGGNVGIGTTNPFAKLSVNGDAMFGNVAGLGTGAQTVGIQAASNIPALVVAGYGTAGQSKGIQILSGTNSSDYALDVKSYASANLLYVRGDGNVGIGTTAPNANLNVVGAVNTDVFHPTATLLNASDYVGIRLGGYTTNQYGTYIRAVKTTAAGGFWNEGLTFSVTRTGTDTTIDEAMRITSNSNVGIGTTNPFYRLQVNGDSNANAAAFGNSSFVQGSAGSALIVRHGAATGDTYSELQAARNGGATATSLVLNNAGGNVGIGNTSPSGKLEVTLVNTAYNTPIANQSDYADATYLTTSASPYKTALIMRGSDHIGTAIESGREDSGSTWKTYLAFKTNNITGVSLDAIQEKMRITGDGNVGIGTTNPLAKLDVNGVIRAYSNGISTPASGAGLEMMYDTSTDKGYLYAANRNLGQYKYLNIEGVPIVLNAQSGGNVGIGTTTPGAKLSVINTSVLTGNIPLELGNTDSVGDGSTRSAWVKYFGTAGNADTTWVAGNTGNEFVFSYLGARATAPDSGSKWLTIQNGGNVGIGIMNPGYKLDVNGNAHLGHMISTYSASPINPSAVLYSDATYNTIIGANNQFSTNYIGVLANTNITMMGGNVGIGTTTPASLLTVFTTTNDQGITIQGADTGITPVLKFNTSTSTTKARIGIAGHNDALATGSGQFDLVLRTEGTQSIMFAPTAAVAMTIETGGQVGIGDTTPDYGLDVVGDINSDDCFREAGAQVAGTCASDSRLKHNINSISGSLSRIMQLRPVEYEWNENVGELGGTLRYVPGRQVGLIAQEMQSVFPNLVKEKNGYLSISYNLELQMAAINAIQELDLNFNLFSASTTVSLSLLTKSIGDQSLQIQSIQADIANIMSNASTTLAMLNTQEQRISALENLLASSTTFITASTTNSTSTATSTLATGFISNLIAWLGDIGNGITKLFAKEVNTESLCVADSTGAKTCVNKSQL